MSRLAHCVAALTLLLAGLPALALPSFTEVRAAHRPSDAWLLARDGTPLATLRLDRSVRRLPWVKLRDISPALRRAVLISEDKRFLDHAGVDWQAAAGGPMKVSSASAQARAKAAFSLRKP